MSDFTKDGIWTGGSGIPATALTFNHMNHNGLRPEDVQFQTVHSSVHIATPLDRIPEEEPAGSSATSAGQEEAASHNTASPVTQPVMDRAERVTTQVDGGPVVTVHEPITVVDPIGIVFRVEWTHARTWPGMQNFLRQYISANPLVLQGRENRGYHLVDYQGRTIPAHLWDAIIRPRDLISMMMAPAPAAQLRREEPAQSISQNSVESGTDLEGEDPRWKMSNTVSDKLINQYAGLSALAQMVYSCIACVLVAYFCLGVFLLILYVTELKWRVAIVGITSTVVAVVISFQEMFLANKLWRILTFAGILCLYMAVVLKFNPSLE